MLTSAGDCLHASLGILDLVTEDLGLGGAGELPIASVKVRELSKFCTISEGSRCSGALIPEFNRQKQEDLCGFKTSLVYMVSSRTSRATWQDYVLAFLT